MSSPETAVDDKKLEAILQTIDDETTTLMTKVNQLRAVSFTLNKLKQRVIRTDVQNNNPVPVYAKPLDADMGNAEMDDSKRLAIYNANMTLANQILSS